VQRWYRPGATIVCPPSRAGEWVRVCSGALRLRWVLGPHHTLLKGLSIAPVDLWLPSLLNVPSLVVLSAVGEACIAWGAVADPTVRAERHASQRNEILAQAAAAEALYVARLRQQFQPLGDQLAALVLAYSEVRRRTEQVDEFVALTNHTVTADLGVSVRSISAAFTGLQREGLFARVPRGVLITDRASLVARAGANARVLFPFVAPT